MSYRKSTLIPRFFLGFQTRCSLLPLRTLETLSSSNTKAGEEKPFSGEQQLWREWEKICLLVISKSLLKTCLPWYLLEGKSGCW